MDKHKDSRGNIQCKLKAFKTKTTGYHMLRLNLQTRKWVESTNAYSRKILCSFRSFGRAENIVCKVNENVDSEIVKLKFYCTWGIFNKLSWCLKILMVLMFSRM